MEDKNINFAALRKQKNIYSTLIGAAWAGSVPLMMHLERTGQPRGWIVLVVCTLYAVSQYSIGHIIDYKRAKSTLIKRIRDKAADGPLTDFAIDNPGTEKLLGTVLIHEMKKYSRRALASPEIEKYLKNMHAGLTEKVK